MKRPSCTAALHMSAFGSKADIHFAPQMSAFDPKRACRTPAAIIQRDKERPIPERRLKDWEHQT